MVLSENLTFKDKLKIKARIFEFMEVQAIHLIIAHDTSDLFVRAVLDEGVPL